MHRDKSGGEGGGDCGVFVLGERVVVVILEMGIDFWVVVLKMMIGLLLVMMLGMKVSMAVNEAAMAEMVREAWERAHRRVRKRR